MSSNKPQAMPTARFGSAWLLITAGFAAIFLLLGMVLWISLDSAKETNTSLATLVENTDRKKTAAYQMRDLVRLRSAEVASLHPQADAESNEKVFEKLVEHTARYNQTRLQLTGLPLNDDELAITEKLHEAENRVLKAYEKTHDAFYSMRDAKEIVSTASGEVALQELVLLKKLNDLVETENQLADESLQENQQSYQDTQKTLKSLALIALLLGVVIAIVVISRVARTNKRIVHLANHDDLTGLANRRSFENKLVRTLEKAPKSKRRI